MTTRVPFLVRPIPPMKSSIPSPALMTTGAPGIAEPLTAVVALQIATPSLNVAPASYETGIVLTQNRRPDCQMASVGRSSIPRLLVPIVSPGDCRGSGGSANADPRSV